jgi:hypothetical protein
MGLAPPTMIVKLTILFLEIELAFKVFVTRSATQQTTAILAAPKFACP